MQIMYPEVLQFSRHIHQLITVRMTKTSMLITQETQTLKELIRNSTNLKFRRMIIKRRSRSSFAPPFYSSLQ